MSSYEFWDELGKIFNAVVAYQEKSVEFNNRFINPWIRLGNVFDKQDRNKEAINAHKKAIELDPDNAQNWYELGNAYFRMEAYEDAADAYNKAICLQSDSGWAYNNLAFTLAKQGKGADAIPLYQKSIDLLQDEKDKAVAWNRLGNVYRKLNQYESALDAFQKADELDGQNTGFRDELDDAPDGPTLIEQDNSGPLSETTEAIASSSQTDVPDSQEDAAPASDLEVTIPSAVDSTSEALPVEAQSSPDVSESFDKSEANVPALTAGLSETTDESESNIPAVTADISQSDTQDSSVDAPAADSVATGVDENASAVSSQGTDQTAVDVSVTSDAIETANAISDAALSDDDGVQSAGPAEEPPSDESSALETAGEQTITVVVQNVVETYTDSQVIGEIVTQTSDVDLITSSADSNAVSEVDEPATEDVELESLNIETAPVSSTSGADINAKAEIEVEDADEPLVTNLVVQGETEKPISLEVETAEETVEASAEATDDDVSPAHAAYEEFLKDNGNDLHILVSEEIEADVEDQDSGASQEPVTKIDASGEVQIEVDTKNARVWNELGNVYFNTDAFDDAVIAYRKAIELDRQFAWPYSNLALTYVQKGRFVEAILLYQRSIELFSSEKDKAISWNRLGNVYRRLNDYEHAISAYQQADELDPDNSTLSMQTRFSLLGNFYAESKPVYVG